MCLCLYRPNTHATYNTNNQIEAFIEYFTEILEFIDSFNIPTIVTGDFNLNLFGATDINSHPTSLLDLCIFYNLLQCISRATRITPNSATLIDLTFIKGLMPNLICSGVITTDISDHFCNFVLIKTDRVKIKKEPPKYKRLINDETTLSFFNNLSALSWQQVTDLDDTNLAFDKFISIFDEFYNLNFPLVRISLNKKNTPLNPFMSHSLLRCRTKKEELSRLAKIQPTAFNISLSKNYSNTYYMLIRTAKKLYFRNKIKNSHGNSKIIWSALKESMGMKSKSNSVKQIIVNGLTISDDQLMADKFNAHFSSIGPSLANSMPSSNKHFSEFLPPPAQNSFFMHPITQLNMKNYILSTKPKSGHDASNYSMKLLHSVASPISLPLSHIFNLSISSGTFPEGMKLSRCIPIFKNGSPSDLDNYRGVVMIDSFSKCFEKIQSDRLLDFLEGENFFINTQFGFRRKTSTVHAVAAILNTISARLNEDKLVLALLVDIKKCFDCLDRTILLKKLENAGVRGVALQWFRSYFNNRKQSVFVNGKSSSTLQEIAFGVLQGSILGVLLFLIFINDIPSACATLISFLFADDNTGLLAHKNLHELLLLANIEINDLLQWYNSNHLVIHPKKTKCLIFKPPRTNLNLETDDSGLTVLPLYLNLNNFGENDPLKIISITYVPNQEESSARLLGILIDDKLSFKDHFKALHGKIVKAIYTLRQMKNLLDLKHLKLLYNSYLKSHLDYGSALFTTPTKSTIKPIILLQKKAIRLVCGVGYRDNTGPLFLKEKLLTYDKILIFNRCRFMFDFKHNLLPSFFLNTWKRNDDVHRYEVRNSTDYFISNVSKPYLKNHPLFIFPVTWNSLPTNLKECLSRKVFSNQLHSYLLELD